MEKTKLKHVVLTFFILFFRFLLRNRKPAKHFGSEMRSGVAIATAKLLANVGFAHSSDFPSAIEVLEALPGESGFA